MLRSYASYAIAVLFVGVASFVTISLVTDTGRQFGAVAAAAILLAVNIALALNAAVASVVLWARDGTLDRKVLLVGLAVAGVIWVGGIVVNGSTKSKQQNAEEQVVADSTRFAGLSDEDFMGAVPEASLFALRDRVRALADRACLAVPGPAQDRLLGTIGSRLDPDDANLVMRLSIENCSEPSAKQRVQAWFEHYVPQKR